MALNYPGISVPVYRREAIPLLVDNPAIKTATQMMEREIERIKKRLFYEVPMIRLEKQHIERVQREVEMGIGIPSRHCGMMTRNEVISEQSLSELLEEIEGKKEDNMDSLANKKIKKVVIECEDGSTFEGEIKRIEGCPFDYRSMMVEAKVGAPVGHYGIKEVIFANPSTIVKWTDGTETVVSCMDNVKTIKKMVNGKKVTKRKPMKSKTYSKEVGLAMCIAKKWAGNKGNYNNIFRKYIEGYTEGKK